MPVLPLRRVGDEYIMVLAHTYNFDTGAKRKINRCRHYLQVTTIADICTGDGRIINTSAWKGERNPNHYTKYNWPQQQRPSGRDWTTWRNLLRKITNPNTKFLINPLGPWLAEEVPTHWPFYYCPRRDIVYSKEAEALEWNLYHRVNIRGRRGREPLFRRCLITDPNAPDDKYRCTISYHGDIGAQVRLTGWCTSLPTPIQQLPTIFSDLIIKK